MCRRALASQLLTAALLMFAAPLHAAEITATATPHGVAVKIDGALFTEYLIRSGAKPILWPILGPTGEPMTRAYPMGEPPAGTKETKDHVHQRSFWFTHGSVNGVNFWDEGGKHGTIVHRAFSKIAGGSEALLITKNDWLDPEGVKVCEDQRRLVFGVDGPSRWIDFDITLKASQGAVTFGDTKEGTFGIRVAQTITVDAKKGGHIVNNKGQTDVAAWGQRADWVDYYGPLLGKTLGIAVLNHPSSFRFPTYWHVRTYGLFAANPFGVHDFAGKGSGTYTLPAGQSLHLRYRVIFHQGDEKEGKIAEAFGRYAAEKGGTREQ
ncbi:MAG: PmoA family protein [Thermoguttaceae bacterium]